MQGARKKKATPRRSDRRISARQLKREQEAEYRRRLRLDELFVTHSDYEEFAAFLKNYKHCADYDISAWLLAVNKCVHYASGGLVAVSLLSAAFVSIAVAYCH